MTPGSGPVDSVVSHLEAVNSGCGESTEGAAADGVVGCVPWHRMALRTQVVVLAFYWHTM